MTGMMPAWLTFSGMYVEEPPNILRPTIRRAYWTGIRRWACSMKMTAAMITSPITSTMPKTHQPWVIADLPHRAREGGDDLGEDQQRHAVADAVLGDQLAEPHDHGGAGGHRDHHDQEGLGAVVVEQVERAALQQVARAGQRHDAGGLQQREAQGEVAGVLGDLRLAGLALLLQGLQPRDHDHQQLQDDAGRDVRHDPQREDRQLEQRATGEQVDQAVEALVLDLVEAGLHVGDVDARCGHLGPEPEDRDDQQDEQQLAPQVRSPECVGERAQHGFLFLPAGWGTAPAPMTVSPASPGETRDGERPGKPNRRPGPLRTHAGARTQILVDLVDVIARAPAHRHLVLRRWWCSRRQPRSSPWRSPRRRGR